MRFTVFYSWQSDLPNDTNRGFIESVIKKAINELRSTYTFEMECCIERDTKNLTGAPDITNAIFRKIDECDALVADVSHVLTDAKNGKRCSPNPNVLLELGYAIRHLGWERIFLFCNEDYGAIESLPFDLRQHRCIGYSFSDESPAARKRSQLSNILKQQFSGIASKPLTGLSKKSPLLDPFWRFRNDPLPQAQLQWSESETLKVVRAVDIQKIINQAHADVQDGQSPFAGLDPMWERKFSTFKESIEKFIEALGDQISAANYQMVHDRHKASVTTLGIINRGNARATNAKVEVELPSWFFMYDKIPEGPKMPKRPIRPQPSISPLDNFGDFCNPISPYLGNILPPNLSPRTAGCFLKGNSLVFWIDTALHKHRYFAKGDVTYILAHVDAPIGLHTITARLFCEEYDDWQERELYIDVLESDCD